jgi:hypothetical protein
MAKFPPAECPYCGDEIDVPMVTAVDSHSQVRVYANDVEWNMHVLVQHPDKERIPPAFRKKKT